MKSLFVMVMVIALVSIVYAVAPEVSNVTFSQRLDGSKIIDIHYDLYDGDGDSCLITLLLSENNGSTYSIQPSSGYLAGDVGAAIAPGTGKHILWYAEMEDYFLDGNSYRFKVIADDGSAPDVPPGFVYLPARTFIMGNAQGLGDADEFPLHSVTLESFCIAEHEVTQGQFQRVMGFNPSIGYGVGPDIAVYNVNWYTAIKYCNLSSIADGLTPVYWINGSTDPDTWGAVPLVNDNIWNAVICNWDANGYRLPTEAEWEYAARAGTNDPDHLYAGSNNPDSVAWYQANSYANAHEVATKNPNALGIYDMSGNVSEWCWDWYGADYYNTGPNLNPRGPDTGIWRDMRSGYWGHTAYYCRVAHRSCNPPDMVSFNFGFRLCRSIGLKTDY